MDAGIVSPRSTLNLGSPPARCDGFDVFVVDDNESLRTLLVDFLRSEGYRIECARNGRSAIRQLEHSPVRVVLTDIFMPEADGFELIMHLRRMNPPPLVLAMSGDGSTDPTLFLKTARQLGAREVLIKPFPLAELLGHLHGLIGTP